MRIDLENMGPPQSTWPRELERRQAVLSSFSATQLSDPAESHCLDGACTRAHIRAPTHSPCVPEEQGRFARWAYREEPIAVIGQRLWERQLRANRHYMRAKSVPSGMGGRE